MFYNVAYIAQQIREPQYGNGSSSCNAYLIINNVLLPDDDITTEIRDANKIPNNGYGNRGY